VKPFLDFNSKWTIILGLTSNPGSADFELQRLVIKQEVLEEGVHVVKEKSEFLYERVLEKCSQWGNEEKLMFVIGATQSREFENTRKLIPQHFFLVPGVGSQGGSLKEISEKAMIADCGLLVNVSRAVIFASDQKDFAEKAREVAKNYQLEMSNYLPAK
jgi:orotidine-5'-phosphate decarboxylase